MASEVFHREELSVTPHNPTFLIDVADSENGNPITGEIVAAKCKTCSYDSAMLQSFCIPMLRNVAEPFDAGWFKLCGWV